MAGNEDLVIVQATTMPLPQLSTVRSSSYPQPDSRWSGVPWREQGIVQGTTLGEWADFWAGKTGPPDGFETLRKLPQSSQKRIAAGFELIGRKPIRG